MSVEASRVNENHVADIKSLEDVYPQSMRQSEAVLRSKLHGLARTRFQMSWILHSGERCVGYLLAYPQHSLLDVPNPDRIVYIDDIQVIPGFERELYHLLSLLGEDMRRLKIHHLAIEGVCRREAYRVFDRHQAVVRRLGWELAGSYEYWDQDLGEELCWMRWASLATEVGARVETTDRLALSSDVDEEVGLESSPGLVSLEDAPVAQEGEPLSALTFLILGAEDGELIPAPLHPPVAGVWCSIDLPGVRSFFGLPVARGAATQELSGPP